MSRKYEVVLRINGVDEKRVVEADQMAVAKGALVFRRYSELGYEAEDSEVFAPGLWSYAIQVTEDKK